MKLKSIQFSVAALAGASVLSVVVVLVLYALFAGARTQELVQQRTQGLLEKVINERLVALARAQVSQIQRELEYPLTVVHGLANSTRLLGEPGADGMPQLNASRDEISALLRSTVQNNPKLLDTFMAWEPNAFDIDAAFAGQPGKGYGPDGRYLPWWYPAPTASRAWRPWPTASIAKSCCPPGCARTSSMPVRKRTSVPASSTRPLTKWAARP